MRGLRMDVQAAVTYQFKDPQWVSKAIVGSLMSLLAIPFFFLGMPILYAWALEIARRTARSESGSLPDWSEALQSFGEGFKVFAANVVWMGPPVAAMFLLTTLGESTGGSQSGEAFYLLSICAMPFLFLLMVLAALAMPLQFGAVASTGSFMSAVNPIAVYRFVKSAPSSILTAWLVSFGSTYALGYIGQVLCCVGILPAYVYNYSIWGHLFGQALQHRDHPVPIA